MGGSPTPASQSVEVGELITIPTIPSKEGFTFIGWAKGSISGTLFDFTKDTLTSNITLFAVWKSEDFSNPDLDTYYNSITATSGYTMVNQINTLINVVTAGNGSQNNSYDEVKEILPLADKSIDDPTKLWGIYDSQLLPIPWDHINNWNREHVWPQSLLGASANSSSRNVATDPHNLRASNPGVNSSRGNKYFDNYLSTSAYFPGDAHKGDVARILLYMVVRYSNLSLVDSNPNEYQMSRISLLYNWHQEDPVDAFEHQRNNVIYEYQGNRNPFIDNPSWFLPIWNYYMEQVGLQLQAIVIHEMTVETYQMLQTQYIPSYRDNDEFIM